MSYPKGVPRLPSQDPLFNMLVQTYGQAFKIAENDTQHAQQARLEIVCFFSRDNLTRLYQQGFISWDPTEVYV